MEGLNTRTPSIINLGLTLENKSKNSETWEEHNPHLLLKELAHKRFNDAGSTQTPALGDLKVCSSSRPYLFTMGAPLPPADEFLSIRLEKKGASI